jgi:hypothetical protein
MSQVGLRKIGGSVPARPHPRTGRLQGVLDAVEAELISSCDLPPLKDRADTLRWCGEPFYGYVMEVRLAGAISCKSAHGIMNVYRLMVRPDHIRKGIARCLLGYVERGLSPTLPVRSGRSTLPPVVSYSSDCRSVRNQ